MSFSCSCDCDYPDVLNTTWPCAAKEHRCGECGHVIVPGETYQRTFMVFESDTYTEIMCERCTDLSEAFSALGYCTTFGELLQDWRDWLFEGGMDAKDADAKLAEIRQKHRDWTPSDRGTSGEGQ